MVNNFFVTKGKKGIFSLFFFFFFCHTTTPTLFFENLFQETRCKPTHTFQPIGTFKVYHGSQPGGDLFAKENKKLDFFSNNF